MTHTIRPATADDAGALAALAAVTFPLACPPSASPEDITSHLANTLSERHFRMYLGDPDVTVLVIDADLGTAGLQPLAFGGSGPGRVHLREAGRDTLVGVNNDADGPYALVGGHVGSNTGFITLHGSAVTIRGPV